MNSKTKQQAVAPMAAPRPHRTAPRPPTIQVMAIVIGGNPTKRTKLGAPDAIKLRNPETGEDQEVVIYTTDGQYALAWK